MVPPRGVRKGRGNVEAWAPLSAFDAVAFGTASPRGAFVETQAAEDDRRPAAKSVSHYLARYAFGYRNNSGGVGIATRARAACPLAWRPRTPRADVSGRMLIILQPWIRSRPCPTTAGASAARSRSSSGPV
jgi:hypothetical protein